MASTSVIIMTLLTLISFTFNSVQAQNQTDAQYPTLFEKITSDEILNKDTKQWQDVQKRLKLNLKNENNGSSGVKKTSALRQEYVKLNSQIFKKSLNTKEYFIPDVINISLFQEKNILVRKIKHEINSDGRVSWVGMKDGDPMSIIILTLGNNLDTLAGAIHVKNHQYKIRPLGKGIQLIIETNRDYGSDQHIRSQNDLSLPPEYLDQHNKKTKNEIAQDMLKAQVHPDAASNTIDVLIAYTGDVNAASADIVSEINTDITYSNTALANSCVNFRYRLVGTLLDPTYVETGVSGTDLPRLAQSGDSYLDAVTTYRANAAIKADLVQIWVNNSDVCGLGYAPPDGVSMSASIGFSLKLDICPSSTTAHEMGHNLTLSHDRYQENISFKNHNDDYSYGYDTIDPIHQVMGIMAYSTECTHAGVSCTEIPYFSNPRIFYNGSAMGISDIADSARKLNNNWTYAAAYNNAASATSQDLSGCKENADKNTGSSGTKQVCFIATATYGSFLDPHVQVLRDFRDEFLLSFSLGQKFVDWYYQVSPALATLIIEHNFLRYLSLGILSPLILAISHPFLFVLLIILFGLLLIIRRKISLLLSLFLLASICLIGTLPSSFAQTASPSLDPSQEALNPAAISFRKNGYSISGFYQKNTENYKEGQLSNLSAKGSALGYDLKANIDYFAGEAHGLPSSTTKYTQKLSTRSDNYDDKISINNFNIAYKPLGFVSMGASYLIKVSTILTEKVTTTAYGGGASLSLGDFLFLGGNVRLFSKKSTYTQKVSWLEKNAGAGALLPFGSGQLFRAEVSYSMSKEVIAKGDASSKGSGYHKESNEILLQGEVILDLSILGNSGTFVLLGAGQGQKKEKDVGSNGLTKNTDISLLNALLFLNSKKYHVGLSYRKEESEYGQYGKESQSLIQIKGGINL